MSTICRCDRCKKVIDENEDYYHFDISLRRPAYGYVKPLYHAKTDFCAKCKDKILKVMMVEAEE